MAKIKVRVYACSYCEAISTNPIDFLDTAIEEGSLWRFEDWIAEGYGSCGVLDIVADYADEGKSAAEVLAYLRKEYNQQMLNDLLKLFENDRERDWYYDEIKLDVSLVGTGANHAIVCTDTETHVVKDKAVV